MNCHMCVNWYPDRKIYRNINIILILILKVWSTILFVLCFLWFNVQNGIQHNSKAWADQSQRENENYHYYNSSSFTWLAIIPQSILSTVTFSDLPARTAVMTYFPDNFATSASMLYLLLSGILMFKELRRFSS